MSALPKHLQKYVVEQNYAHYTAEDQSVWRYILRQLKDYLSEHAHPCYLEGLGKTGLETDQIPQIAVMDKKLQQFHWRAIPVSGFIPPAAFMEFQSLGFLPIACDMRSIDHILYTPAPDIVHEAAGHAPILIQNEFADYLKQYAAVAKNAILSHEDLVQYEAIRVLSDLKEHPESTADQIMRAEKHLIDINSQISFTSEAAVLSRMNWWTAEYGLIGPLDHPKIFGAGLLSSMGESRHCLKSQVKKIPFGLSCINYSYNITEPQPQLFVTPDFMTLHKVLEELSQTMAFRRGGLFGLKRALQARTVNTVEFNSGIQISGVLSDLVGNEQPCYLQFTGPCQLSFKGQQLAGQGTTAHTQGFGTPLGLLKGATKCLADHSTVELQKIGVIKDKFCELIFDSGICVRGRITNITTREDKNLIVTWHDCTASLGNKVLFEPAWGSFDMAIGSSITSVFGGPADRLSYENSDDFKAVTVPSRKLTARQQSIYKFYSSLRDFREHRSQGRLVQKIDKLCQQFLSDYYECWLIGIELLELLLVVDPLSNRKDQLLSRLHSNEFSSATSRFCIDEGIRLAGHEI